MSQEKSTCRNIEKSALRHFLAWLLFSRGTGHELTSVTGTEFDGGGVLASTSVACLSG